MKKNLIKTTLVIIGLIISIAITSNSVTYERKTTPDSLCPYHYCQLSGGFPLPHLFDAEGVSRMNALTFGEDHLYLPSFSFNILFYFLILNLIYYLIKKIKSNFFYRHQSK